MSDYVIVGAGSAGAVLANRLSASASVTLIEAGPRDHWWDYRLHMPAALSHVLASDAYNWCYYSEPEPGLGHRRLYCPRGRVLGGSSSINGMIFVRGNPADFDRWAERPGLSNWRYEDCLPYFRRSETCLHGDAAYRGRDGPLTVTRGDAAGPLDAAWLAAGVEAGYPRSTDFNGERQEGVGVYDRTVSAGARVSTARAYLAPAMARRSLDVIPRARVLRVRFAGRRAVGVEYDAGSGPRYADAAAEVILAAGAINSPQLLMLSGIGDADALAAHGIDCAAHLPGVGRNLQDHLEIYVQFSCDKPVSLYPALRWYRQPLVGLQWYVSRTGAGASNHFETGAFLRSDASRAYPDLQFHFLPVAMNYDGSARHDGHGFQVHVGPMKPTSRGSVTLRSPDPLAAPAIRFNYNDTAEDRDTMRRGIEMVREIVAQRAFAGLRGVELGPGEHADTDAFLRARAESAYHPAGSCRMGTDELSVVDGEARVHGVEGLRVVDASIMPEITNGNLNAPVIMMAEKLGDAILRVPAPAGGDVESADPGTYTRRTITGERS